MSNAVATSLRAVIGSGPGDRAFDALLLGGPAAIAAIAMLGRTPFTVGLAGFYLAAFLGKTAYNGVVADSSESGR